MARIYGNRVMLREYRMQDAGDMYQWVNDPVITRFLNDSLFFYPQGIESVEATVNDHIINRTCSYVIADLKDESYIGQADLFNLDYHNRFAELGIVIGNTALFNKGIGTEAVGLMMRVAFEHMNLHRVELNVYSDNHRAIRCYEKCGFHVDGILRQKHFKNGAYADITVMSLLEDEYKALKSR